MTLTPEHLAKVVDDHGKWLRGETGGVRADLSGVDLSFANLRDANLSAANLSFANLRAADLSDANLSFANLRAADLSDANLRAANLRAADLSDANLRDANLRAADLSDANLSDAKNLAEASKARLSIVPECGAFEAWKKCLNGVVVRLLIPADANRSNATGRKCRAERVEVLEVIGAEVGISTHDRTTEYRVGATVRCDSWCSDRWQECAGGIHFFITRVEAEEYAS